MYRMNNCMATKIRETEKRKAKTKMTEKQNNGSCMRRDTSHAVDDRFLHSSIGNILMYMSDFFE